MTCRFIDAFTYCSLSLCLIAPVLYLAISPPAAFLPEEAATVGHNSENPMDVNGDGLVGSGDAALLVEFLKRHRHALPFPVDRLTSSGTRVDVNGDGYLSQDDAASVILHLNNITASTREPASSVNTGQAEPAIARR